MVKVVVGKDQIKDTKDFDSTSKPADIGITLNEDNKIKDYPSLNTNDSTVIVTKKPAHSYVWVIWLAIIIVIVIFFVAIVFSRNNVTYYYGDDYYSSSTTTTITKTQDGRVVTTITKNRPQISIGWLIFWFVFILLIFSPTYYYYK